MIVLNVNNLLDAARDLAEADPTKLQTATVDALEAAVVAAVRALAEVVAQAEGVTLFSVANEPGFGGLCADFVTGPNGETSGVLAYYDQGGEWA